jgi:hypothetical protein
MVEETILRPEGGIVVVRRANVTDAVPCQYEPSKDFDPGTDAPLIAQLSSFNAVHADRQNQACLWVLDKLLHR